MLGVVRASEGNANLIHASRRFTSCEKYPRNFIRSVPMGLGAGFTETKLRVPKAVPRVASRFYLAGNR